MAQTRPGHASLTGGNTGTHSDTDSVVVDNWPTLVPITSTEAEIVDRYLGRLIDMLFNTKTLDDTAS